jgi:hypothetical protein
MLLSAGKTGRTPSWLQIIGINNLVCLLFSTIQCDIFHNRINLLFNEDRSIKLHAELHLACTDLDGIGSSSFLNLTLKHGLFLIDWLNFLLTGGRINSVICQELQPLKNLLVRCPLSPKKSLASLVDSVSRSVSMDPKSGTFALSGEDTIAFDSLANLLS